MMTIMIKTQSIQIAEALGRRNDNVTNESFEFGKNRTEYRRMLEDVRENINHHVDIFNVTNDTNKETSSKYLTINHQKVFKD